MTRDEEIIQRALLSAAHFDYEKGLNRHSFFKTHNHALSDDLVQDCFIKTWQYLLKGGKIETIKAFLYHVLNNLIVDEYRRKKTTSLNTLFEKGIEISTNDYRRLFDVLDGKEAILLIDQLPPHYHKVLRMRYVQDLTLKEISLLTGQSRNTVAVQAHRGLEKLKALYYVNKSAK